MFQRGQSGLDAVAAMVVALLVLAAFGPVSNAFQESQKEISLRQQLRQNVELAGEALTYAHWYRSALSYLNGVSFSSGKIPLFSIRAAKNAQGYECHPSVSSSSPAEVQMTLLASDTHLAQDVVEKSPISIPVGVSVDASKFSFVSCEEPLEWLP